MNGYILIFALLIVGDFITKSLGLSIPGSILGLVILFLIFCFKGSVSESIESSAKTLLKYLPLFLVPIGVGVKELLVKLDPNLTSMILVSVSTIISAVLITVFTIYCIKYFSSKIKRKKIVVNKNRDEV